MIRDSAELLARLRAIHVAIRDAVVAACEQSATERLAVPLGNEGGDTIYAVDRVSDKRIRLAPRPSRAPTIAHGFGGLARFVPGGRDVLAAIDDAVAERLLGPVERGSALTFEDQYISTGGQLYELLMGHDRWVADVRPLLEPLLHERGRALGLCCHSYDLCTESIARAAGVIVTDECGERLTAP